MMRFLSMFENYPKLCCHYLLEHASWIESYQPQYPTFIIYAQLLVEMVRHTSSFHKSLFHAPNPHIRNPTYNYNYPQTETNIYCTVCRVPYSTDSTNCYISEMTRTPISCIKFYITHLIGYPCNFLTLSSMYTSRASLHRRTELKQHSAASPHIYEGIEGSYHLVQTPYLYTYSYRYNDQKSLTHCCNPISSSSCYTRRNCGGVQEWLLRLGDTVVIAEYFKVLSFCSVLFWRSFISSSHFCCCLCVHIDGEYHLCFCPVFCELCGMLWNVSTALRISSWSVDVMKGIAPPSWTSE